MIQFDSSAMSLKLIHTTLSLLLFLFISFLAITCSNSSPDESLSSKKEIEQPNLLSIIDTSCLTAYVTLDLEEVAYLTVGEKEYALLDSILTEASQKITLQDVYTPSQAKTILKTIYQILQKHQIRSSSYHGAFSMCLRFGIFDCDINTLLYLTIAEQFDLPIKAILMPSHIMVVWQNEKRSIYWETLTGKENNLDYYLRLYDLDTAVIGKSMQFVPLNRKEILSMNCYNIGTTFIESGDYDRPIPFLRTAMQLTPDWFKPYSGMAYLYQQKGLGDNAIYYANQSLMRFPQQYDLLKIKGMAYQDLGCDTEALAEYELYLEQLPRRTYNYAKEKTEVEAKIKYIESL